MARLLKTQPIEFGEWLPDQPRLNNSLPVVINALPNVRSWQSIAALTPISTNSIDGTCLRTAWTTDSSGTVYNFAADETKIYRLIGTAYSDVSQSGGYSSTSWDFIKWGDRVIATSQDEPMQYYDLGSSSNFADLAGSPPLAKHIAVVRDFIVTGNIASNVSRIHWSGFNNSEQWTPSQATQSDFQDLKGRGGDVQRIVGGEYGVVFQENTIWQMSYVGAPLFFRFDEIERGRGTPAGGSVAFLGEDIYFWGHDGFYHLKGREMHPIGHEKVDEFIRDDLDTTQLSAFRGSVDRKNKLVLWSYPSLSQGKNQVIVYRWDLGRWGYVDESVDCIFEFLTSGQDLDTLDSILIGGIDVASINVDSTDFRGGVINMGGINSDGQLVSFTGSPKDAIFETGEQGSLTRRQRMKSVRPVVDGDSSLEVGVRESQNENVMFYPASDLNALGEFNYRSSNRFHTLRLTVTGGFDHAQGLEVIYREGGRK